LPGLNEDESVKSVLADSKAVSDISSVNHLSLTSRVLMGVEMLDPELMNVSVSQKSKG
jgi:hypothetical protein